MVDAGITDPVREVCALGGAVAGSGAGEALAESPVVSGPEV